MPSDMTQHRPGVAISLKLSAVFLFMVMAALVKSASGEVPAGQAVFFRSFFAMPVIVIWIWQMGQLRVGLIPSNLMGHIWRGLFGTTAMILTFAGLGLLPLPEVTAIGYATPMFTVVFAALLLGERIRLVRIGAVALGLVGVLIVLAPRLTVGQDAVSTAATLGAVMVLIAAILRALVQIHVRRLVQTDHTAAIAFYFSVTASTIGLLTWPLGAITGIQALAWAMPPLWAFALLVLSGLVGGVAQIMVTASYRYGGASMLAPFDYASMIFATLIGYVAFSEIPTLSTLIGASLVIAGGVLIIWRERQLGLDRRKSKPNEPPTGAT